MAADKSIIIGCGDADSLSAVLGAIGDSPAFRYKLITATRSADLNSLILSVKPDLLLLYFNNNRQVISSLCSFVTERQLPVVCLTQAHEAAEVSDRYILFSMAAAQLRQDKFLSATLNGIFMLQAGAAAKAGALAGTATERTGQTPTSDLSRYVMELEQKKSVLHKVKERIAELYPHVDNPIRVELTSIVNSIRSSVNDTRLWDDFRFYFEQNNPGFLFQLAEKHPDLTPIDLKYCCYMKMNMSNDDIRHLLGINQESVRTHKYRLKKKMSLSPEEDLRAYLNTVDKTS